MGPNKFNGSNRSNKKQNWKSWKAADHEGPFDNREEYEGPHEGSIPLEEIQASEVWASRINQANKQKRKYALCVGYLGSAYQG